MILKALFFSLFLFALTPFNAVKAEVPNTWKEFERMVQKNEREENKKGLSYLISGGFALTGGLLGESLTKDPIEKGIYGVFLTIGVASIGYGAHSLYTQSEFKNIYAGFQNSNFTEDQKNQFLKNYYKIYQKNIHSEKKVQALTYSLIAALNFYKGSQEKTDGIKNSYFFLGAVSGLAALSYTFQFH